MADPKLDQLLATARQALRSGDFPTAGRAYELYLQARPADEAALMEASLLCQQVDAPQHITVLYERAMQADPRNRKFKTAHMESVLSNGDPARARNLARAALDGEPDFIGYRLQLAQAEQALGNKDAAREEYARVFERDASNLDALYYLAEIGTDDQLDAVEAALEDLWQARSRQPDNRKVMLGYAFGRLLERRGDYDRAWEAYRFGAEVQHRLAPFSDKPFRDMADQHKRIFVGSGHTAPAGNDGNKQIFVVSLPRAGSTLLEQILASHAGVETIGETSLLPKALAYLSQTFGASEAGLVAPMALTSSRQFYEQGARQLAKQRDTMIVDKGIMNFLFLGYIRFALPGAKIIHVVRDPVDTGLSCHNTLFYGGNEWTYDLHDIARFTKFYQQVMRDWIKAWPDRILTVRYEDIVQDTEQTARRVVDFCGLEWDPACLDFHKSEMPVMSASVNQVRQPIYTFAKGRAGRFESHITPLRKALGDAANPDWFL